MIGGIFVNELERMLRESQKFTKQNLDRKKEKIRQETENYRFKNLLDAVELLFELRAKRVKSVKDHALIDIIEGILQEQPFEYMDEDFILSAYKDSFAKK